MIHLVKVLSAVFWVGVLSAQPSGGIVNKKRNSTSQFPPPYFYPRREFIKKKSYLDTNRPLWVLEDKVPHTPETEIATHRPFRTRRRFIPATLPPKLPSHYVNLDSAALRASLTATMPRNHKRRTNHHRFPVFDDFQAESEPILIYRGPKAEMIFNTMMTSRRYPMSEPVPGQVMYPPYSPQFKPTPVVERVKSDKFPGSVFHNVTLIPFYAHEAIDPRQLQYEHVDQTTLENDTNGYSDEQNDFAGESNTYLTGEEEDNEPPCYHSYYSQDEVQAKYWSLPYTTQPTPQASTSMSLNRQLSVPNGIYPNHRMEATTPMPQPTENPFRIMYDTENETPPPRRYKSVHTAKYGGFKTIYPIHTLNKLLKFKPYKQFQKPSRRSLDVKERKRRLTVPPPEETWLIWNSRHKSTTHTASNYLNPMSSKLLPKNHHNSAELETKILVQ